MRPSPTSIWTGSSREIACPPNMTCLTDMLILGCQAVRASPKFWYLRYLCRRCVFETSPFGVKLLYLSCIHLIVIGYKGVHFTSRCTATPWYFPYDFYWPD